MQRHLQPGSEHVCTLAVHASCQITPAEAAQDTDLDLKPLGVMSDGVFNIQSFLLLQTHTGLITGGKRDF